VEKEEELEVELGLEEVVEIRGNLMPGAKMVSLGSHTMTGALAWAGVLDGGDDDDDDDDDDECEASNDLLRPRGGEAVNGASLAASSGGGSFRMKRAPASASTHTIACHVALTGTSW